MALPRLCLAHLPTPLEPAPSLGRSLGIDLLVKRDDATGLALGGNKARKLEFLLADAREKGADTLLTFGGVQSNHARMTAAAAAHAGLECHLLLGGRKPSRLDGNILLDRLLGAGMEFLGLDPAELTAERVERAFQEAESRLRAAGRTPYRIPAGGSGPLGVTAYALAFREILEQAESAGLEIATIVVAFGTGGTLAGLSLGKWLSGSSVRILPVSVAPPGMPAALAVPPVGELVRGAVETALAAAPGGWARSGADLAAGPGPDPSDLEVNYDHSGPAYAAPTEDGAEAIRLAAREEGLLLDPIYTGKAMAGLIRRARKGGFGDGSVLFLHTGGAPALFTSTSDSLFPRQE